MSAVTPRTRFVKASGRARFASALGVTLALVVSGCSAEPDVQLTGCSELIPQDMVANALSNPSGQQLIQLHDVEDDAVSPLVNEMVNDGVACGGSVDGAVPVNGAVVIGQLAVDEQRWTRIQADFAADGLTVSDDAGVAGWLHIPLPHNDPSIGTGFVWRDGVLFFAVNPVLFVLAAT